jgi:transaldolase
LWASTSTKNPEYSDVKYVEPLIGAETINTLPLETLSAYRDHGDPALRLDAGVEQAYQTMDHLDQAGIDLAALTQQLEDEGVEKFTQAYHLSLEALEVQRLAAVKKTAARRGQAASGRN